MRSSYKILDEMSTQETPLWSCRGKVGAWFRDGFKGAGCDDVA
jgi:hypothetical protein